MDVISINSTAAIVDCVSASDFILSQDKGVMRADSDSSIDLVDPIFPDNAGTLLRQLLLGIHGALGYHASGMLHSGGVLSLVTMGHWQ